MKTLQSDDGHRSGACIRRLPLEKKMIKSFGIISGLLSPAVLLYRFWVSEKTFVLFLATLAVTTATARPVSVIAGRPVLDEKNQQEQGKCNYGGC